MGGNAILGVPLIGPVFDAEALFARNFESLHSSKELGGLPGEHWTHYELNSPSLFQLV
jgi:hypothetical protein